MTTAEQIMDMMARNAINGCVGVACKPTERNYFVDKGMVIARATYARAEVKVQWLYKRWPNGIAEVITMEAAEAMITARVDRVVAGELIP